MICQLFRHAERVVVKSRRIVAASVVSTGLMTRLPYQDVSPPVLATALVPMVPLAPGQFTTIVDCPGFLGRKSARSRDTTSVLPPGRWGPSN